MDIHHNHLIYRCQDRDTYRVLNSLHMAICGSAAREAEFLAAAAEFIAEGRCNA